MLRDLPIALIDTRPDARVINEAAVEALAESIAAVGLINPIRVRASGERWEVIAGAHRLAACTSLGLIDIAAVIVTDDDLHAELAMIDENLCREELSPTERAQQTARRKAIYLELNPDTGRGGDRKSIKVQSAEFDRGESFVSRTAQATGKSASAVYLDVQRGEKIIPEVMELIKGTKLDTGLYLDRLKKLPPNDQYKAATRDLLQIKQQERIKSKVVKVADHPLNDEEAREKQVAALMAAWNKASKEAREEFLLRIEEPVMDRSAA